MSPSWYDILDVEPDATADDIRAAWRRSIDGLDPTDRRFAVRNQAAAVLLDPAKRTAYDAELTVEAGDPDDSDDADDGYDADAPVVLEPAQPADRPAGRTVAVEPTVTRQRITKPVRAERPAPAGATASAEGRPGDGAAAHGVPGWLLTGLAVVVALVAGLGGYVYAHSEPRDAVDDAAESARATAEKAVGPAFSYDYRDMEASRATAEAYMTDSYVKEQFNPLYSVLIENAQKIKPVVTAEFVESGVTAADADRVDVLVTLDQTTRKPGAEGPSVALLYATLRMVLVDGNWLIDDIITKPIGL